MSEKERRKINERKKRWKREKERKTDRQTDRRKVATHTHIYINAIRQTDTDRKKRHSDRHE